MIIQKIYNNNVVLVIDESINKELVLTGCGIGFQQKIGQIADESKIEKKFIIDDKEIANKFTQVVSQVDENILSATYKIVDYAKSFLNSELDDYIYASLADHLSFAFKRHNEGIDIKNDLLYEIKRIHKKEFEVGKWAIGYINEKFNVNFPIDEAAFIAVHILNANYKETTKESFLMTNIIKEILNIIRYEYGVEFNQEDFNYDRLINHLKFFAQRLIKKEQLQDKNNELIELIKIQYKKAYDCSLKIKIYIESKHEYTVTEDELLYLTLHINRVISSIK